MKKGENLVNTKIKILCMWLRKKADGEEKLGKRDGSY